MENIFTYCFYAIAAVLLIISLVKSREKTVIALKKAWTMFIKVLPQFVAILLLVGILLAVLNPETIQKIIGAESGFLGMMIASALGSISLIPVLVAFPVAAELLNHGAGVMQISVFISTLTMVGFITIPMEFKYFGKKIAIVRNALAYLLSFVTAFIIGVIL